MNKDVIYIDVEDDVTAIIGKIKASQEKIIALVPPKRAGILQSAVNLRLLDRMASTSHKKLVLITNNQALIALSSAAGIPVAKNLQSKPELAEITALNVDDEDDVIDGSSLPIGELEKTSDRPKSDVVDDAIEELDIDDKKVELSTGMGAVAIKKSVKSHSNIKVPNFNAFRKRLFLGIVAGIILILFLVWANVFAPAASIIITAKTTPQSISDSVTLSGATPTDVSKATIASITKTIKKDATVQFTPTGQKDVGVPAAYNVTFTKLSQSNTDVPAGTSLSASDGLVFVTQSDVTIPAYDPSNHSCFPNFCAQSATGAVIAQSPGTNYNNENGSLSGAPSGVNATFHSQTTDGTASNVVTVISSSDIATATAQLTQQPSDTIKSQLQAQFGSDNTAIPTSFTNTSADPVSSPAVGAQLPAGTTKATLTSATTYTMLGFANTEVEAFLKNSLSKQIAGNNNQRVYDDGLKTVSTTNYALNGTTSTVTILATAQIGPSIDIDSVKQQVEGKKAGEAQSIIGAINGISNVTVNFSYPWVTTVPGSASKVDVQFKLTND